MLIDSLSTAASTNKNEDLVTSFTHPDGTLELLVFDGASSVSDQHYLDTDLGDPAWFVQQFSATLKQVATPALSQADSMHLALQVLREQHKALLQSAAMPCYAWPIAALTWLRVHASGEDASIYALGDCKSFLLEANASVTDLDPYDNPQEGVLKSAIDALRQEGLDEQARWARLLPMLRERRVSQNMSSQPSILCLYPQAHFAAREHQIKLKQSDRVLIMSDGFYRLVDSYHLYDTAGLLQACVTRGLPAMMQELREYETDKSGETSVKKADDATVAMLGFVTAKNMA